MIQAILAAFGSVGTAWKVVKALFPLILGVTALAAVVGVYLYTSHLRSQVQDLTAKNAIAVAAAEANDAALKQLAQDKAISDHQVLVAEQQAAKRQDAIERVRKEINRATNSSACLSSGPIRALLGGLRSTGASHYPGQPRDSHQGP